MTLTFSYNFNIAILCEALILVGGHQGRIQDLWLGGGRE